MTELQTKMMTYTNRLFALSQEQQDKGNMAMHYILGDIRDGIEDVLSDERHKGDSSKDSIPQETIDNIIKEVNDEEN